VKKCPCKMMSDSRHYRSIFPDGKVFDSSVVEQIIEFDNAVGLTSDRVKTLCVWILYDLDRWVNRWNNLKEYKSNGTLKYMV
jgi:hypothetical protein